MLAKIRKLVRPVEPRGADAPTEELEAQLEEAEDALAAAREALDGARDHYDADGSAAAEDALLAARQAAQLAEERRDRARRLLERARERDAAEVRARLEAEVADLQAEIDRLDGEREALARAEAEALRGVVEARFRRLEQNQAIKRLASRRRDLRRQIGGDEYLDARRDAHLEMDAWPNPFEVAPLVRELAAEYPAGDPRQKWLRGLEPQRYER
jgi:chromosome segregation ATPase